MVPARVEALFSPAAHYLTQEPVETDRVNLRNSDGQEELTTVPINAWAPIRSIDNCYSYGAMTGRSKCKMSEAAGHGMNVILETENRHVTYLQCPEKVRKGENLGSYIYNMSIKICQQFMSPFFPLFTTLFRAKWAVLRPIQWLND